MHYFTNHSWCSDSNWGGHYDCRYIITIDRIPKGKTYYDSPEKDWVNLVESRMFFDKEEYDSLKSFYKDKYSESDLKRMSQKKTYTLKKEVREWLKSNIKDRKGEEINKGWCIGSDRYNSDSGISIRVFFHRRVDALNFIKEWSEYKKPTTYFDYFKDIRKELKLETMKLEVVKSFSK